jgi:hypothetical protein
VMRSIIANLTPTIEASGPHGLKYTESEPAETKQMPVNMGF